MTIETSQPQVGSTYVAREFLSDYPGDASVVTAVVEVFTEDPEVLEINAALTLGDGIASFVNFDFSQVADARDREAFEADFADNMEKLNRILATLHEFRTAYADAGLDVLGAVVSQ